MTEDVDTAAVETSSSASVAFSQLDATEATWTLLVWPWVHVSSRTDDRYFIHLQQKFTAGATNGQSVHKQTSEKKYTEQHPPAKKSAG